MKKSIFNIGAIKKQLYKQPLNYINLPDDITICWNSKGYFAIRCKTYLFDAELKNTIPTAPGEHCPQCIYTTFAEFEKNVDSVLCETFLTMDIQDKTARLYQNYKHKYITPIDTELLKILKNPQDFTPWQYKQNSAVLFKNDFIDIILMPLRNTGIKEKLTELAESLKQ